jgi:hypothetical protein
MLSVRPVATALGSDLVGNRMLSVATALGPDLVLIAQLKQHLIGFRLDLIISLALRIIRNRSNKQPNPL